MLANMMEVRARGGPVIPVITAGDREAAEAGGVASAGAAGVIEIPAGPELLSPLLVAIPMQLFAYHIADMRGEHIDQPRNLAKTVTVE
jgi:glucosamine--fructose-6-phosphate aminotransferase (isomerizing)